MRKNIFLFVVLSGTALIVNAQAASQEQPVKKGCSCSFSSIAQAGLLSGSKGAYYQLQSINGIKYKTWFAGVGVGIENYYRTGIPLFVDVRKSLSKKSAAPFLYADVGVHIVRDKNDRPDQWYENQYQNGAYAEAGAGHKFGFSGKDHWLVTIGYSYKYVKYRNVYIGDCPTARCYENYYTYRNYLHRFVMKLGFQL
jgi:hypothetical protein